MGLSCNAGSELSRLVDAPIEVVVGPEAVAGSTRMKAGTAQKMVLNMVTTAAMIRLGRVHDGYMVGVQASNVKLAERCRRTLSSLTGLASLEARALDRLPSPPFSIPGGKPQPRKSEVKRKHQGAARAMG